MEFKQKFFFTLVLILISKVSLASKPVEISIRYNGGDEKKVNWTSFSEPVLKQENGFEYHLMQTWIAVPPLLSLESQDGLYKILKNNISNRSPFVKDKSVQFVILIEHSKPFFALSLKKKLSEQIPSQRLDLQFKTLQKQPFLSVSKRCQKLGVEVLNTKDPYLLSIDCKIQDEFLLVQSVYSGNLDDFKPHKAVAPDSVKFFEKNRLVFSYKLDKSWKTQRFSLVDFIDQKGSKYREVIVKGPWYYESTASKPQTGLAFKKSKNKRKYSSSLGIENETQGVDLGLLLSKKGLEFEILNYCLYSLNQGCFEASVILPFKYFIGENNKNNDVYADVGLVYNKRFSQSVYLGAGAGLLRVYHPRLQSTYIGPRLVLDYRASSGFFKKIEYSTRIIYTTYIWESSSVDHRFLWEFAKIKLPKFFQKDLFVSFKYSALKLQNNSVELKDHKIMGGVHLIW